MKTAIYPGSFDPVTFGHLDIIKRSASLADHLIVGVLNNSSKTPLFSVDERVNMIKEVTADIPNVEVLSFSGLLVDFARKHNVQVIIRALQGSQKYGLSPEVLQSYAEQIRAAAAT